MYKVVNELVYFPHDASIQHRTIYLKSLVITKGDKIMQIGHVVGFEPGNVGPQSAI